MSAWAFARTCMLGVVAASWALVGCVVEDGSGGASGGGGGYTGGAGSSGSSSGSSGNGQPMLVDVDPNQTMSVNAGDGVGVFTEYQTGGHWHVYWTCDTNKTSLPCSFDVKVTVSTGSIANVASQLGDRADNLQQSSTQVEATTNTTSGIDGVTFDTVVPSGTTPVITLEATMDGVDDPTFLFFVQKGQVNGNYAGALTDPLMLEPSTP